MGVPLLILFIFMAQQKSLVAQQSIQEVESRVSAVVQQAKSQLLILANQLVTNVSLVTRSAEGFASLLLANLHNDINKGIAEAQAKATQIGNVLQANFSKQAEEVMVKAAAIYTKVQEELRNSTSRIEEEIGKMIASTEVQIKEALNKTKFNSSLPFMLNPPKPTVEISTNSSDTP